jgi:uncharacterized membrane protein YcjF (UPF0283 family)
MQKCNVINPPNIHTSMLRYLIIITTTMMMMIIIMIIIIIITTITEVIKLKEYVEHTDDPLMQIVRTHQHSTSSTLFHIATNLQKSLQSDTKQIKTTIARKLKERW